MGYSLGLLPLDLRWGLALGLLVSLNFFFFFFFFFFFLRKDLLPMWDVVPGRRLRVALDLGHSVTATPRSLGGQVHLHKVCDMV
jgi:hypothetical protein